MDTTLRTDEHVDWVSPNKHSVPHYLKPGRPHQTIVIDSRTGWVLIESAGFIFRVRK